MKKFYFFAFSALVSLSMLAQRQVTFRVDMTGQTVNANGVHVAGSFQNPQWTPGATGMTQVGTTNIYTKTVTLTDGLYEFKFLNGNAWGTDETIPAESGIDPANGNGNRFVNITKDTTLAAVPFAGNNPVGKVLLRFAVDMTLQTVSANGVHIAGNFQQSAGFGGNWIAGGTRMYNVKTAKPNLYERIVYVDTNSAYEYKFINDNDWPGGENVPAACQVGGGNSNRHIAATAATVAPEVCFSMCVACPTAPIPSYMVTFNVDMRNYLKCNAMTYMDIAGTMNKPSSFSGGDTLKDANNDSIYTITMAVDSGAAEFKFRAITTTTNWEGVPNRQLMVSGATTVDFCFNEVASGFCTPIPSASDITFRVDFAQATVIPAADIYVIADFLGWQGGALLMAPKTGNPGVYEVTVPNVCPGTIFYKFVNGDPTVPANEEGPGLSACGAPNGIGGYNRTFTRTNSGPVILQYVFDSCTQLTIGVAENGLSQTILLSPNPMGTHATVALGEGNYSLNIVDVTGRLVRSISNATGNVIIERDNLTTGIYFLNVANAKGEAKTVKFVVE